MMDAYLKLIQSSHSLAEFASDPEPERLVRRLGTASGGESVMIRAALSLLPQGWLPESAAEVEFRLEDVARLDGNNTRALLEVIALKAQHPEALNG